MDREWDDSGGWSDGPPDDWGPGEWEDFLGGPDDAADLDDVYFEPDGSFAHLEPDAERIASRVAFATPRQAPDREVYHLTSTENLARIATVGAMLSPKQVKNPAGLGAADLVRWGYRRDVPIAPGGVLAEYVRFYFTSFTPYSWHAARRSDRDQQVLLIARVQALLSLGCVVTDRNALSGGAAFRPGVEFDDIVRWDAVHTPYSRSNHDHRQAELLVAPPVPTTLIERVVARNLAGLERARALGFTSASLDRSLFY